MKSAGLWVPAASLLLSRARAADITYFGKNITTGGAVNYNVDSGSIFYNAAAACPGTGNQSVVELGSYVQLTYGAEATAYFRIAIYTAAGAFVMQGATAILCTHHDSPIWQSHTAFVDASGNPITSPVLTGGDSYLLAIGSPASSGPAAYFTTGSSGDGYKKGPDYATNYAAGMPSPIGTGFSASTDICSIRCGVTPAAAPPSGGGRRRVILL
jgi:hypothetical protein